MKKALIALLTGLLTSCMATPDIHVAGRGTSMRVTESSPVSSTGALSADGKYFLAGGWKEGAFKLWDLSQGVQVRSFPTAGSLAGIPVAFTPDGKRAISGGSEIKIWDLSTGKEIRKVDDMTATVVSVSSDGKRFVALGRKSLTKLDMNLYDMATGDLLREFRTGSGNIKQVALSPDGRYALTGHLGGSTGSLLAMTAGRRDMMVLWDTRTGEEIRRIEWRTSGLFRVGGVNSVSLSPDGSQALSGGADGTIRVWDVGSGTERLSLSAHPSLGGVSYTAFSRDGRYILSGGLDSLVKVWDAATGVRIREFRASFGGSGIHFVELTPDGKRIVSMGGDSSVRVFDFVSGEELAVMIGFKNGEWLAITSDGYYNASEKGAQFLKLNFEGKDFAVDQFYDVFYRPDIVAAKLKGDNIVNLITLSMKEAAKNPPPMVEISPLEDTDSQKVNICYRIKSTGGGIGEVRLFHNGKLIESDGYYRETARGDEKMGLANLDSRAIYDDMRSVSIKNKFGLIPDSGKAKGDVFNDCREVEAIPGDNEVSVAAFNAGNTVQSHMKTVSFQSRTKAKEPHLYILAVGIDEYRDGSARLRYAAKDARDLQEKLRAQSATLYRPENIHCTLLTDKEGTKKNLSREVEKFATKVKPQDSFILFVAGHGVLLQNQYYMLTHDFNGAADSSCMLSSNEIVEMSKKIKSLSQLFIFDTCHAGGVDYIVSGLYDARISVLAKKMGLHIYASASDKQPAVDGYKGNGLFTHSLLDGLSNNRHADKNGDGKVSIVGLGEYSKGMTVRISKEIGHAQTPLIINFGKDYPIYQLQ